MAESTLNKQTYSSSVTLIVVFVLIRQTTAMGLCRWGLHIYPLNQCYNAYYRTPYGIKDSPFNNFLDRPFTRSSKDLHNMRSMVFIQADLYSLLAAMIYVVSTTVSLIQVS